MRINEKFSVIRNKLLNNIIPFSRLIVKQMCFMYSFFGENKFNGKGEYFVYDKNSSTPKIPEVYRGTWVDGQINGKCILTTRNGKHLGQVWNNGTLVSQTEISGDSFGEFGKNLS